jgi:D-alanyl-lipoteichoic acid acyltransferase DltB (MBOAT superfamily)
VAGPIERATVLLPQIRHKTQATFQQVKDGLWLILWGYFLKVFMADNLASLVQGVYGGRSFSGADVLIATYSFAFQILGDFAGYSSIAIGVAKLFGVDLTENFRFPYFVTNPSAFWQNWHISLSSWLRDYLYIPLGGNRGTAAMVYRNLLLTMILGGLWHGAAWNFVVWGLFQGLLLVAFRRFTRQDAEHAGLNRFWRVVLMFHITCVGWLFFRTPDMATSGRMLGSLCTNFWDGNPSTIFDTVRLAAYTAIPLLLMFLQFRRGDPHSNPMPGELRSALVCAVMIFCLLWMGNWGTRSFIYFQF